MEQTESTKPRIGRFALFLTFSRITLSSFGGALFWADGPLPSDRCKACVGATVGFEILFGDAYDRELRRHKRAQTKADQAD